MSDTRHWGGDVHKPDQDPDFLRSVYSSSDAYACARLITLGDGAERGVRVVAFRTAGGLEAEIVVDRGGDIGRLALHGKTMSWHAPHGMRAPWLLNLEGDNGQGFLRGYNGFLNTCGLDHIRQPESDILEGDTRGRVAFPLHGSSTFDPTRLIGYGLDDKGDEPFLWCDVERIESIGTRNALRLRRKFVAPVWGQTITLRDEVVNIGHSLTSHMMLYHFNLGYPLISPHTLIRVDSGKQIWASAPHDPLAPFPAPDESSESNISVFELSGERTRVKVESGCRDHAMEIDLSSAGLPYLQLLKMTKPGLYGLGIEPCTTGARTRREAREIDELAVLKPGEARAYAVDVTLFNSAFNALGAPS